MRSNQAALDSIEKLTCYSGWKNSYLQSMTVAEFTKALSGYNVSIELPTN
jgi:hypothetical protein